MIICVNDEHSEKALPQINFTEEGIIICSRNEHFLKALTPIDVTDEGMVIDFNVEHNLYIVNPPSFNGLLIKYPTFFG